MYSHPAFDIIYDKDWNRCLSYGFSRYFDSPLQIGPRLALKKLPETEIRYSSQKVFDI